MSAIAATKVERLPRNPENDRHYVFSRLSRTDVTQSNHGLHKYPAKFIPQIPRWAFEHLRLTPGSVVLDPFCGSGTTLVEGGVSGYRCLGVDISPLACALTRAKTADLDVSEPESQVTVAGVIDVAQDLLPFFRAVVESADEPLGLHSTWRNWFRAEEMAKLLAIRAAIGVQVDARDAALANFLLVCLSSIAKSSSYLSEDQIKVRYDHDKVPAEPFAAFASFAPSAVNIQSALGKRYRLAGASFETACSSAASLPVGPESVDAVVTSPPYVNAVDYTMAHKYNLFLLGLLDPADFKDHCRAYIGVTERAVRAVDVHGTPCVGVPEADEQVQRIRTQHSSIALNRAYVLAQFFAGMRDSLREMRRVLRPAGSAVVVIGTSNRICGVTVPTADVLERIAHAVGFDTSLRFYHELANRSSMRLNRSDSGGTVKTETVLVLERQ